MTVPESITRHYADHVAHQQHVWEAALAAENFDAAVIHAGSQIISFLDDYHYPFRPNPHFLSWLPLTRHDESVLVIRPGERPVLWFYQPDDYWYLPPSDPASWWADQFDVRAVQTPGAWREGMPAGRVACIGDAPELANEPHRNPEDLVDRLHISRTCKTPYEIACLDAAAGVAARAHRAAEQAFYNGGSEFDIHMAYLAEAELEDAQLPYGNIVALNEHGAVLHYQQRQRAKPAQRHSFLIDAGATVHAYCSDITRTYAAAPGEFADMIQAMDEMQLGLCDAMRPGEDYGALHVETHRRIAGLLQSFGIINVDPDEALHSGLSSVFYPHGLGHYLGLQTHDVAGRIDNEGRDLPRPEGHPFLRLTRSLEPGNVLTVEPGFYFIDSLLKKWRDKHGGDAINWEAVERFRPCGGIRIEDNIVVTEGDPINLTRAHFAALG